MTHDEISNLSAALERAAMAHGTASQAWAAFVTAKAAWEAADDQDRAARRALDDVIDGMTRARVPVGMRFQDVVTAEVIGAVTSA